MAEEFALQDEEAQKFLKKIHAQSKKISDGERSFAEALSPMVFADIIAHFEEQRGSSGPWKKWSHAYQEHMRKSGKGGNRILQDTGHLRMSFTPANYRRVPDGILWFNPAKTRGGFPYAAAHDEGGGRLPKRDFMWLSDNAKDKIESLTLSFLEKGL